MMKKININSVRVLFFIVLVFSTHAFLGSWFNTVSTFISANTVFTEPFVILPRTESSSLVVLDSFSLCDIKFKLGEKGNVNYTVKVFIVIKTARYLSIKHSITDDYKLMFVGQGEYYYAIENNGNETLLITTYVTITPLSKEEQDLYLIAFSNDYLWYVPLQPLEQKEYSIKMLNNKEYIVTANVLSENDDAYVDLYISPVPANQTEWSDVARKYTIPSSLFFESTINLSETDEWLIIKSRSEVNVTFIVVFSTGEGGAEFSIQNILLGVGVIIIVTLFLKISSKKQRKFRNIKQSRKTISAKEARKHSILSASSVDPRSHQLVPYTPPLVKKYIEEQKEEK